MRASGWRVAPYRGFWAVIWYDDAGVRRRHSLGKEVTTKRDALLAAPSILAQYLKPETRARTVGQMVEEYLKRSDAISIETLKAHWKAAMPTFGQLLPAQVTEDLCRKYAKERKVKPGTILKELGVVRAALKKAKATEATFWMPPQPLPRDRRLTRDEMRALVNECRQPHLLLFVLVARYTAARMSAILSLRWDQVDFERRQIDLGGHGRQKRRAVVPMHDELAFALAVAKEFATSAFVIEFGGQRVHSIKKGFAAACDRAGISGVSPHVLRHTAASWMAERGVPMVEIAQFLGHSNPQVTYRTYARFSPDYLKGALSALGDSSGKGIVDR